MSFKLLDCTLRDGGYLNDWNFGKSNIEQIVTTLTGAGIDYVELGFVKGSNQDLGKAEFSKISDVDKLDLSGPQLAVMVESGYPFNYNDIPESKDTSVRLVRIIVWKSSINEAFEITKSLLCKGYKVCINLTRTDQYTLDEFTNIVSVFLKLDILAIYIVDTFGRMYLEDFQRYSECLVNILPPHVSIGIHSHNNLAQSNFVAQYYCNLDTDREYIIDATLSGIGRGAGNTKLEILLAYLNRYHKTQYNDEVLLRLSENLIEPVIRSCTKYITSAYVYAAQNNINPEYVVSHQDHHSIIEKLSEIPTEQKIRYR